MIGVIDCGINNIGSLLNALKYLKLNYATITSPDQLIYYEKYILPGVGSFDSGISALKNKGLYEGLIGIDWDKKSILGICLGMQMLCESSEEGTLPGLGLLKRPIIHLSKIGCEGKIPHVGFNEISRVHGHSEYIKFMLNKDFYFVHSFGLEYLAHSESIDFSKVNYGGVEFISAFKCGNVYGSQFHPEKSGLIGLKLLEKALKC